MEPKKLEQRHVEQTQLQENTTSQVVLEFAHAEDLLRYDAARVTPPPRLARRVSDSIARESRRVRSWWRRLWG